jgi:hypothetical protein
MTRRDVVCGIGLVREVVHEVNESIVEAEVREFFRRFRYGRPFDDDRPDLRWRMLITAFALQSMTGTIWGWSSLARISALIR